MASPTQWTWVSVDSGSWWWTGRPGVLRFMGSQRVWHDWATELKWKLTQLHWWVIKWNSHLCTQLLSHVWRFMTSWIVGQQTPLSNSPGNKTGMGSHSLLQGIFLTQGWNLNLLHCRHILYCLSYQRSPTFLLPISLFAFPLFWLWRNTHTHTHTHTEWELNPLVY